MDSNVNLPQWFIKLESWCCYMYRQIAIKNKNALNQRPSKLLENLKALDILIF